MFKKFHTYWQITVHITLFIKELIFKILQFLTCNSSDSLYNFLNTINCLIARVAVIKEIYLERTTFTRVAHVQFQLLRNASRSEGPLPVATTNHYTRIEVFQQRMHESPDWCVRIPWSNGIIRRSNSSYTLKINKRGWTIGLYNLYASSNDISSNNDIKFIFKKQQLKNNTLNQNTKIL